jgi:hypothetical protein
VLGQVPALAADPAKTKADFAKAMHSVLDFY